MKIIQRVQKNKHFYGTIGSLNLGALCVGLAIGWPSPSFAYLYDKIGITTSQQLELQLDSAWMESAISAGASVGSLASIFVVDTYGRRISFALSASILVGFWIFLTTAGFDKLLIISAACMAGLGIGIFAVTTVLYVAEISLPESRGTLGTAVILSVYLGVFAMNLLGRVVEVTILLSVMVSVPMCFLMSIYFWMIESPFHLFQQGTVLEAKISLKKLRDCNTVLEIDDEYKTMVAFFNTNFFKNPGELFFETICPIRLRPITFVVIPILFLSQMLGLTAICDYAEKLIETIYPKSGHLFTSLIDVISVILCLFAIERFGRKPLLILTIIGSGLCCFILSIYNLVDEEEDCQTKMLSIEHSIIPISMICLYYSIYALGVAPVLPIVAGETFPSQAKTAALGICSSLLYLVAFCTQRSYVALNSSANPCLAFVCFTMLGSIGLPIAVALLPETRGKSLWQIQTELESMLMF